DVRAALVPRGDSPLSVVAIQAVVLLIGLVLQTLRYERGRWALTAPVFYIGGLLAVLCTPWAGLCAFVLAWVLTSVAPNAQGFLVVQAMVAAIVAYWLNGLNLFLILGFVLGVVPVIFSLLMKKPLVVFSRRSMSAARGVSS
ncbi:MAG TPA: hypothetical protein V6D47_06760, partial [Oscillatoriaceae cyanobacterium]